MSYGQPWHVRWALGQQKLIPSLTSKNINSASKLTERGKAFISVWAFTWKQTWSRLHFYPARLSTGDPRRPCLDTWPIGTGHSQMGQSTRSWENYKVIPYCNDQACKLEGKRCHSKNTSQNRNQILKYKFIFPITWGLESLLFCLVPDFVPQCITASNLQRDKLEQPQRHFSLLMRPQWTGEYKGVRRVNACKALVGSRRVRQLHIPVEDMKAEALGAGNITGKSHLKVLSDWTHRKRNAWQLQMPFHILLQKFLDLKMNLYGSTFEEYAHGPGFKPQFVKK